jgi:hypothetical protein
MTERSTEPISAEGVLKLALPWQREEITSSFGPVRETIVGSLTAAVPHIDPMGGASASGLTLGGLRARSDNLAESTTVGPQKLRPAVSPTRVLKRVRWGWRAFEVALEWEGVVHSVNWYGFQCRIVPIQDGVRDDTKVEITEFSFDDLATQNDRVLAVPGAIFYWTIGRSRNEAGTIENASLVRFRRLVPLSQAQARRAEQEAATLYRILTDPDVSPSAGG